MDVKTLVDVPPWEWPRNAAKIILETLINRRADESDRLIAAELAGDLTVMSDEMADALLGIVGSGEESEELRATAAIALGPVLEEADIEEFEDPDAVSISEQNLRNIQDSLHKVYLDEGTPKEVRRRILEAAVRAPQPWQQSAIQDAYSSRDRDWVLTAVFSMRHVRGFDDQILEALENMDVEIEYEAVKAAGTWGVDAAWPHILSLVNSPTTPKDLRLAAIEAIASIRPREAEEVLAELAESDDEEIAEAADEALAMARAESDELEEEEDESE